MILTSTFFLNEILKYIIFYLNILYFFFLSLIEMHIVSVGYFEIKCSLYLRQHVTDKTEENCFLGKITGMSDADLKAESADLMLL